MLGTSRRLRVFLCYASQDKPIVRELYRQLRAEGWIDPWLDEEKLLPGQDWDICNHGRIILFGQETDSYE